MTQLTIFVIRAIVGFIGALIVTRMFYGDIHITKIVGIAIVLVGIAYFAEYLRHRKNR